MNERHLSFHFILPPSSLLSCARLGLTRKMPFLYSCGATPVRRLRRRPKVSLGPYTSAVFMLHFGGLFVKHAFRLSRAGSFLAVAIFLLFGALAVARAQTLTPTPSSVVFQITNSTIPPTPTPTASPTPTP